MSASPHATGRGEALRGWICAFHLNYGSWSVTSSRNDGKVELPRDTHRRRATDFLRRAIAAVDVAIANAEHDLNLAKLMAVTAELGVAVHHKSGRLYVCEGI